VGKTKRSAPTILHVASNGGHGAKGPWPTLPYFYQRENFQGGAEIRLVDHLAIDPDHAGIRIVEL
jgi:hypothetical protein